MLSAASGTTPAPADVQVGFLSRIKSVLSSTEALSSVGGLAVLTESGMRDIAGLMYNSEQSGGANENNSMDVADALDFFQNFTRENAILNSGIKGDELARQMLRATNAAITMDSFIRLLGSVVGYNCLNYRVAKSLVPNQSIPPVKLIDQNGNPIDQQLIVDTLKPYFKNDFNSDSETTGDDMDWISESELEVVKQNVPFTTEHIFFALDEQVANTKTRISNQSDVNIFQSIANATEAVLELKEGNPYPFNENVRDDLNQTFDISLKNNSLTIRDPVVSKVISDTLQFFSTTPLNRLSEQIQSVMQWTPVVTQSATKRKQDDMEATLDTRVVKSEPPRRMVTVKRRKVAPASAGGGRKTRKRRVAFK